MKEWERVAVGVLVAFVVVALFAFLQPETFETYIRILGGTTETREVLPIALKDPALEARIAHILEVSGKGHGRATPLPQELFEELPPFPWDFYRVEMLHRYYYLTEEELVTLDEAYWKQPEWYSSFEKTGVEMMKDAHLPSAGTFGYGAYMADTYRTAFPGDDVVDVFFFHASWRVRSYQGIMLVPSYNSSALEVSVEPEIFLLAPTHPRFYGNWTQKVVVRVRVKEGAAPGTYVVGVEPERPPPDYEEKWGGAYTYIEPQFKMGMGRPFHRLHLTVGARDRKV